MLKTVYLVCTRPWVQFPVLNNGKKNKTKTCRVEGQKEQEKWEEEKREKRKKEERGRRGEGKARQGTPALISQASLQLNNKINAPLENLLL